MYMLTMTGLSMILTFIEAIYMACHMTRKGVQRQADRAADKKKYGGHNQSIFQGYDASNFQENMMTMRSSRGIKNSLMTANSFRNGKGGQ